ncbi:hypothetical protein V5E97_28510 [Singulisphaera sp. Ch08]|uniref:Uncharacterized protein n=1 Tax=Singulisphaera sp. Ch08 TaxID=3120278 RepID=A0AAU7CAJ1_9BACT
MKSSYGGLAGLTLLAFTPGCFDSSENQSGLEPVLNERGIITYRYPTSSFDPSAAVAAVTPGLQSNPSPLNSLKNQQQEAEQAYQEMRRNAQERARQQLEQSQSEEAYQELRRNLLADQARNEQQRKQVAEERQRLWNQQESQRIQDGAMRLQQASQELDSQLQLMRQQQVEQQQQDMRLRQQSASNGQVVYDLNGVLIVP